MPQAIRKISEVTASPAKPKDAASLPAKIEGTGQLFIWPSAGPSFERLLHYLRSSSRYGFAHRASGCVTISLNDSVLVPLGRCLGELLSPEELRTIQALYMPGMDDPGLSDFPRVSSLQQFITMSQCGWLVDMLAEKRMTSHFQPIVDATDTSIVHAQEALLRGIDTDGKIVSPWRIFTLARDAGMLVQVDAAARRSAFEQAGRHEIDSHVFINFSPTSFLDPGYSLTSTLNAIRAAGLRPDRVVFEVTEADRITDLKHLKSVLDFYRDAGFKVALDDLGSGYSSLNLVHQLRPDIVKLDMELVRDVHKDEYKAIIAQKILELTQHLGITTVAEGVETREELAWVREHGADFVQGYLIAKPAATPVTNTPSIS